MKLDLCLTPLREVNPKWIKDLNVIPGITKLLEENIEEKLLDIGLENKFLDTAPKAQATQVTQVKINKWDYIKLKHFCVSKETINKMKRQPVE